MVFPPLFLSKINVLLYLRGRDSAKLAVKGERFSNRGERFSKLTSNLKGERFSKIISFFVSLKGEGLLKNQGHFLPH